MRIALLSDCYLPRLGGIEVQVHDLARHLLAAGHDVEVFTATVGDNGPAGPPSAVEGGIRVHRHPVMLLGDRALPIPVNPFAVGAVRRALVGGRFDVAHVHMGVVSPFATDMAGLALRLGMPTAVTWHCVVDRSAPLWRGLGYAASWARRGAALSAVSSMAARRVSAIAAGARVEVLGNGIDVDTWRAPAGVRPLGEDPPGVLRVVSAQRMVWRKRPFALLQVLARARELLPAGTRLEATIVGDGPRRAAMRTWLERAGMDWVSLPGRVDRDRLRELHWVSDAYVSAARLEAFGIAPLEARTAGLAVVVLAQSGSTDFVDDGVSGLIAADDEGLARALVRLGAAPGLLRGIREHNAATPPAQDWPSVVAATLEEYHRAGARGSLGS